MAQTNSLHIPNHDQDNQSATASSSTQSHYQIPNPIHINLSDSQGIETTKQKNKRLHEPWRWRWPNTVKHSESSLSSLHDRALQGDIMCELTRSLTAMYDAYLFGVAAHRDPPLRWEVFQRYAEAKEVGLWHEFSMHGGRLDSNRLSPLSPTLDSAGIKHAAAHISQLMACLNSHSNSTFSKSGNSLLRSLPNDPSIAELYQYCNVRYPAIDGRHPNCNNLEDHITFNGKGRPAITNLYLSANLRANFVQNEEEEDLEPTEDVLEEENEHSIFQGCTSLKFLFAGGIAGAVSRTCTAPFDRIKVFMITRPPDLCGTTISDKPKVFGVTIIKDAITRIYAEGAVLAFWTGNGLSVAKIFPESAIKFFAYESAKRAFAHYWDCVDDPRKISGTSRFLAGGIGGISAQLSIYPIETVKTQMMSDVGQKRDVAAAIRRIYSMGGIRTFYTGLAIGLVGVFPYAAIDMSTFEALKLAYIKSSGKEEPGILALLAFGSVSGSIGAISVYPLNFVRTRLQASGSPGHPQRYNGVLDVATRTWEIGGWRAFYRGLLPTLAKVIPSVSISYVVYEYSKRKLGV